MSAKNTPLEKKVRRMRRALKKGRTPRYLDLVVWLKDHGHAGTTGAAKKLIHERRVVSESHPLGFHTITTPGPTKEHPEQESQKLEVYSPHVPARLRPTIQVLAHAPVA